MPCPCRTVERSGDVEVVVVCLFEGTALCAQFLVSATRHRSHFSVDIPTTRWILNRAANDPSVFTIMPLLGPSPG